MQGPIGNGLFCFAGCSLSLGDGWRTNQEVPGRNTQGE